MRAADPATLGAWYRDCLGLETDENGLWHQEAGVTVVATFGSETEDVKGIGRFGWVTDPEGNRVELWQPS